MKKTKISLLGDSIRLIGYGTRVPELLGDGYVVYQPEENCRFAKHTLRGIFDWADGLSHSDVIHWNNGLWDTCHLFGDGKPFTEKDEYVNTMARIAEILLRITPNVIFATTTPVLDGQAYNYTQRIKEYNEAVVPVLLKMGVVINDLFALVSEHADEYIKKEDKIHLNEQGTLEVAKRVADCIREVLNEKQTK